MSPFERERYRDEIKSKTAKINVESIERVLQYQDLEENKAKEEISKRHLESNVFNTLVLKRIENRQAIKKTFYKKIKKENEEILKTTLTKNTANTLK